MHEVLDVVASPGSHALCVGEMTRLTEKSTPLDASQTRQTLDHICGLFGTIETEVEVEMDRVFVFVEECREGLGRLRTAVGMKGDGRVLMAASELIETHNLTLL